MPINFQTAERSLFTVIAARSRWSWFVIRYAYPALVLLAFRNYISAVYNGSRHRDNCGPHRSQKALGNGRPTHIERRREGERLFMYE